MKKYYALALVTLLITLMLGCSKIDTPSPLSSASEVDPIVTAQEAEIALNYFFKQNGNKISFGTDTVNIFEVKPLWNTASVEALYENKPLLTVLLDPLVPKYPRMFTRESKIDTTSKFPKIFTFHKVAFYKEGEKIKIQFVSKIWDVRSYGASESKFTGMMAFWDEKGKLMRGSDFEYGKSTKSFNLNATNSFRNARGCQTYMWPVSMYYYVSSVYGVGPTFYNGTYYVPYVICDNFSYSPTTIPVGTKWIEPTTDSELYYYNYNVTSPPNPIRDIREYLKCFSKDPNCYYRVIINVDQPTIGSSTALNTLNKHKVGHVSITLVQGNPALNFGVVRSFGFWPGDNGTPTSPEGSPGFNDDSQYTGNWDVSKGLTIDADDMLKLVEYFSHYGEQNYHLMTRNCGTMVVDAMRHIGVNLPTAWSNSTWYYAPIKYMSASGFPQNAGWTEIKGPSIGAFGEQLKNFEHPKMQNAYTGYGRPSPNHGSCN